MSIIRQTRIWNGIPTRQDINNETGAVYVYAPGKGAFGGDALLFRSDGNGDDWVVQNPQVTANLFNKANGTNSSAVEINKAFLTSGKGVFNNDRAAVLNSPSSYDGSGAQINQARTRLFNQGIPRIIDPTTQRKNNDKGKPSSAAIQPAAERLIPDTVDREAPPAVALVRAGANIGESGESTQNPDDSGTTSTSRSVPRASSSPKMGLMRYPLNNLEGFQEFGISYDYIKFTVLDYQPSLGAGGGSFGVGAVDRYSNTKDRSATIILPMTTGLSSTNGISWGSDNMNVIQKIAAEGVNKLLQDVGSDGFSIKAVQGAANNVAQNLQGAFKEATENPNAVAAALAGYVVGNSAVAQRTQGVVINPNMELLFGGPQLRSFNFNFQFAPRFPAEAEVVAKIVKAFKMYAAPVLEKSGAIFLRTPKVFQLEYTYNDGEHPFLNKFKPCALTSISVNYTPGSSYMTYPDGSPVTTVLGLSFTELEPIYDIDYQESGNNIAGY